MRVRIYLAAIFALSSSLSLDWAGAKEPIGPPDVSACKAYPEIFRCVPVHRRAVGRPGVSPSDPRIEAMRLEKMWLTSLITAQLRPHWNPPTGDDAELLVTRLSVHLNKDGSLADAPQVESQQGVNDNNRAQASLHAQRAIEAVRRAAPFKLPERDYERWRWLMPLTFDKRLSK